MTIKEIVVKHLREIGADGLVRTRRYPFPLRSCTCSLEGLMECRGNECPPCVPGKLVDGVMVEIKTETGG